ncbi:MAG: hypothetical protein H0V23_13320 [Nocardioidaceae bacterium]|nr:hypothetical protein [Nocardioidaceae bacterium]
MIVTRNLVGRRLPLSRLAKLVALLLSLLLAPRRGDRGDVPGWVMITVMTAGLVAILTAVAGPALKDLLQEALSSVGG